MTRKINTQYEIWWEGGNKPPSAGWVTTERETKYPFEHEYPLNLPSNLEYDERSKKVTEKKDPKTNGLDTNL